MKANRLFSLSLLTGSLAVSMAGLVACSAVNDMHDMQKTTKDMANTTRSMEKTTGELAGETKELRDKTEAMRETTNRLYQAARQGTSLQLREELLKDMQAAKSQSEKAAKAGKYFMAFEYQIWGDAGFDTEKSRDEIAATAVEEFLLEVQRFMVGNPQIDIKASAELVALEKSKPDANPSVIEDLDNKANLNALALALHQKNLIQDEIEAKAAEAAKANSQTKPLKSLSMLSMLMEAVTTHAELKAGKIKADGLPLYVHKVRENIDIAVALLQIRHNVLSGLVLKKMAGSAPAASPEAAAAMIGAMARGPWPMARMNGSQIRALNHYILGIFQVRGVLEKSGIALVESLPIKPILINATPNPEDAKGPADATEALAELQKTIQQVAK